MSKWMVWGVYILILNLFPVFLSPRLIMIIHHLNMFLTSPHLICYYSSLFYHLIITINRLQFFFDFFIPFLLFFFPLISNTTSLQWISIMQEVPQYQRKATAGWDSTRAMTNAFEEIWPFFHFSFIVFFYILPSQPHQHQSVGLTTDGLHSCSSSHVLFIFYHLSHQNKDWASVERQKNNL